MGRARKTKDERLLHPWRIPTKTKPTAAGHTKLPPTRQCIERERAARAAAHAAVVERFAEVGSRVDGGATARMRDTDARLRAGDVGGFNLM